MVIDSLYFVTSNVHKFMEVKEIVSQYNLKVKHIRESYPEVQADSIEDVMKYAAKWLAERYKLRPLVAEDAGLFIRSLKGFPGVYSAFVYRTIGIEGILHLMNKIKDRYALFKSVVALIGDSEVRLFVGKTEGYITRRPKGAGWGFDPIFSPKGWPNHTYASLGRLKNRLSHRYKSFKDLVEYIIGR